MAATFSVKTIFSAVDAMTSPLNKMRMGVEGLQKSTKNSLDAIGGKWIERGLMAGAVGMGFLAKSAVETAASFESIKKSIVFASGSQAEGVKNLQFLDDITKNLAIDYTSAAEGFKRFLGATQGQLTGNEQRDVFTGMSKAIRVLGLDSEQTGSVFRALGEVVSKGTLQAQELKVQLANALPGASKAQADALNMSVTELFKNMQSGSIDGLTAVKKLAEYMGNKYAPGVSAALDTASAKMTILGNSWKRILESIGLSIIGSGVLDYINEIASSVLNWVDANKELIKQKITDIVNGLVSAFKWIVNNWSWIVSGLQLWFKAWLGLSVVNIGLSIMSGTLASITALLLSNPFGATAVVISALVISTTDWASALGMAGENTRSIFTDMNNMSKAGFFDYLLEGANLLLHALSRILKLIWWIADTLSFGTVDFFSEQMKQLDTWGATFDNVFNNLQKDFNIETGVDYSQFGIPFNQNIPSAQGVGNGMFLGKPGIDYSNYNTELATAKINRTESLKNTIDLRINTENGTTAEVVNQTGVASVKVTNNIGKGTGGYMMK